MSFCCPRSLHFARACPQHSPTSLTVPLSPRLFLLCSQRPDGWQPGWNTALPLLPPITPGSTLSPCAEIGLGLRGCPPAQGWVLSRLVLPQEGQGPGWAGLGEQSPLPVPTGQQPGRGLVPGRQARGLGLGRPELASWLKKSLSPSGQSWGGACPGCALLKGGSLVLPLPKPQFAALCPCPCELAQRGVLAGSQPTWANAPAFFKSHFV